MNWHAQRTRSLIVDLASRPAGVTAADVSIVTAKTAREHLTRMRDEGLLFEIPGGQGRHGRFFGSMAALRKFHRDQADALSAKASKGASHKVTRAWWSADAKPVITEDTIVTIAPSPTPSLRTGWGPKESWR